MFVFLDLPTLSTFVHILRLSSQTSALPTHFRRARPPAGPKPSGLQRPRLAEEFMLAKGGCVGYWQGEIPKVTCWLPYAGPWWLYPPANSSTRTQPCPG